MKKNIFNVNIETLILVSIWDHPFVFQGSFNITNTNNNSNQLLIFRCYCKLKDKKDILEIEFSPFDYQFTHLYSDKSEILLINIDDNLEKALYILKYSLKETLQKLIINTKNFFTYIDEISMSSMTRQIKEHLNDHGHKKLDNKDIGFAVSINFTPTDSTGKIAASTLLKINKYGEGNPILEQ